MRRVRIIPTLLVSRQRGGLVKGERFRRHRYVGDPINAVKVFNDKLVDELCLLDVDATRLRTEPDMEWIEAIASEAFMPLAYGGGVRTLEQARRILRCGAEKVVLNTAAVANPGLISEIASLVGSQSVVVSLDVKRSLLGRQRAHTNCGRTNTHVDAVTAAMAAENAGAGELLLTNIDREGTMAGLDVALISRVSEAVQIPVIASGGAASMEDFLGAVKSGASAVAAGAMFVFVGRKKGVLINYPDPQEIRRFLERI